MAALLAATGGCIPGSAATHSSAVTPRAAAPAPATPPPPVAPPLAPAVFTISAHEQTQGGWLRGKAPDGTVSLKLDDTALVVAPDGSFFAAFDRDAGPSATLVAQLDDGREIKRKLTVSPRAWKIEHVSVGKRPGGAPSKSFMRRRAPELARIHAARAQETGSLGWRQKFIWPVKGRISGYFGSQRIYRGTPGSYHSGTDIATGESGTTFVAPADGVVVLAADSPFSLEGLLLMIDHGAGLNSAFLHCSSILVKEGDRVRQGQPIGKIGMTGRATGPHLHWSIKWRDARLDPILLTGPM